MNGDVHQKCLKAFVQNVGKGFEIALGAALAEFQRLTAAQQHESAQLAAAEKVVEAVEEMDNLRHVSKPQPHFLAQEKAKDLMRAYRAAYPPKPASGTEDNANGQ